MEDKKRELKTNKNRKVKKELFGILLFMGFLVVVFLVSSYFFKSFNSFEYEGPSFTKEKAGKIPIFHYFYYFTADNQLIKYNLYLRNDPRENLVPLTGDGIVSFRKEQPVYFAIDDTGLDQCEFGPLAVANLVSFLSDNQLDVVTANLNFLEATHNNETWTNCKVRGNPVIELYEGKETKVDIGDRCYKIQVNNCEILEAVEKFQVKSVLDSKRGFLQY
jgi:hypothetical protein